MNAPARPAQRNLGRRLVDIELPSSDASATLLRNALWIGCGGGAVLVAAHLFERKSGRVSRIFARVAGVVLLMRLATFVDLNRPSVEWVVEVVLQLPIAIGGVLLFFKVKPRDASMIVLIAMVLFVLVYLVARFISFVLG